MGIVINSYYLTILVKCSTRLINNYHNDERFSFLTTLVGNNFSDVSTRCSSPPQGGSCYQLK